MHMEHAMDVTVPARAPRDVAGRVLLAAAAAVCAMASATELAALPKVGPEPAMLAGWRALGLAVFAGVFALLAWRPQGHPGLFELTMGHKLAMTVYAVGNLGMSTDATAVSVADGLLTSTLAVAYVLVRAHRAWLPPETPVCGVPICCWLSSTATIR